MRGTTTIVAIVLAALATAACGSKNGDDPGAAPAPTVTKTVTVTAEPPDDDDSTPDPIAPSSDPCDQLMDAGDLAFIVVTNPFAGEQISGGSFGVRGCSNSFEAAYQWELLDRQGNTLDEGFGTASSGSGQVGRLSFTAEYEVAERAVATLRVFSDSPEDGSEVDVNSIPVILEP